MSDQVHFSSFDKKIMKILFSLSMAYLQLILSLFCKTDRPYNPFFSISRFYGIAKNLINIFILVSRKSFLLYSFFHYVSMNPTLNQSQPICFHKLCFSGNAKKLKFFSTVNCLSNIFLHHSTVYNISLQSTLKKL